MSVRSRHTALAAIVAASACRPDPASDRFPLAAPWLSASNPPAKTAECSPDPKGRVFDKIGCAPACAGSPPRLVDVCIKDDMGDVVGASWLMQKLAIRPVAAADPNFMTEVVAFGPLDPPTAGDFAIVRLVVRLGSDGTSITLAPHPQRDCMAATTSSDYATSSSFKLAVDRVCRAAGAFAWRDGKFERRAKD